MFPKDSVLCFKKGKETKVRIQGTSLCFEMKAGKWTLKDGESEIGRCFGKLNPNSIRDIKKKFGPHWQEYVLPIFDAEGKKVISYYVLPYEIKKGETSFSFEQTEHSVGQQSVKRKPFLLSEMGTEMSEFKTGRTLEHLYLVLSLGAQAQFSSTKQQKEGILDSLKENIRDFSTTGYKKIDASDEGNQSTLSSYLGTLEELVINGLENEVYLDIALHIFDSCENMPHEMKVRLASLHATSQTSEEKYSRLSLPEETTVAPVKVEYEVKNETFPDIALREEAQKALLMILGGAYKKIKLPEDNEDNKVPRNVDQVFVYEHLHALLELKKPTQGK